jgi:CDP-diacylglycerol--glycerol-3-phosphate 3-phosphatidyltransferase
MKAARNQIPNLLSGFRLVAAPFLLVLAWFGHPHLFLLLLSLSLLSDSVDGFIARKMNVASELGTRLDSWGDLATYLTVPVCAWWLWPEILKREAFFVWVAIGAYVVPIVAALARFRRLPSYHTWAAKVSAVLMSVAALLLFVTEIAWPFRIAALVQALEAMEEILITVVLPAPQGNVHSLWHARRIKKRP